VFLKFPFKGKGGWKFNPFELFPTCLFTITSQFHLPGAFQYTSTSALHPHTQPVGVGAEALPSATYPIVNTTLKSLPARVWGIVVRNQSKSKESCKAPLITTISCYILQTTIFNIDVKVLSDARTKANDFFRPTPT